MYIERNWIGILYKQFITGFYFLFIYFFEVRGVIVVCFFVVF